VFVPDSAAAALPASVPHPNPLAGNPAAALLAMYDDTQHQMGIWESSPGEFPSDHTGYVEFCHVLEGEADVIGDDGTAWSVGPGSSLVIPDGWTGRWVVRSTVRKVFAIARCDARGTS
jgi:uncharacterized cupin superfamily protein